MERLVPGALVTAFALLVLLAMVWGWRARRRRQSAFGAPTGAPDEALRGEEKLRASVLYVATTTAGDPLDRLTIPGLAFRGRGTLAVYETGLAIAIPGEPETFIAREHLRSIGTSTWTIDRVVEPGGLVRIDWTFTSKTGPVDVESYLRATELGDAPRLIEAASAIIPNHTPQGGTSS
ncbi:PH-like domain-containing protein [Herbiconiux liangxiaofengii]|uniref:PH-like domain-containing protein n=1 Tax=Herbiconiux liangxiaofengii TaxID=3342795 RepID=UPI0035B7FA46